MTALPMLRRGEVTSLPALRACWVQPPQGTKASSTNATVLLERVPGQDVSIDKVVKPATIKEKTDGTSPSARASKSTSPAKKRVGRPSRLTRDKRNLIMTCLQFGQSRQVAAKAAGISTSTITRTMQRDPLFAADIAYAEEVGVLVRREFKGGLLPGQRRRSTAVPANTAGKRPLQNTVPLQKGTPNVAKKQPVSRPTA